jgi:hypothetical protein
MKLYLLIIFFAAGCRGTVHEYCNQNMDRFADYEQCYQEESAHRARMREAFKEIGESTKQTYKETSQPTIQKAKKWDEIHGVKSRTTCKEDSIRNELVCETK